MDARLRREKDFHNKSFVEHTRSLVRKYYSVATSSRDFYRQYLKDRCQDKLVLEYGCGPGSHAFFLAENGATVTGIDISDTAILKAKKRAKDMALQIDFRVMNAEKMEFNDNAFDIVCGTSILHHLNLRRASYEISRTLKEDGFAIFSEPLGHNIFINFYRKMTPRLRTKDEHPLLMSDLDLAKHYFNAVRCHFFCLTSILAVPFRSSPFFSKLLDILDTIDKNMFKYLPFIRRYAWGAILIMSFPKKVSPTGAH